MIRRRHISRPSPPPSNATSLPNWTRLDEAFTEIRIVDLDAKRTTWSRVHESMRIVYLRLNRAPDLLWIRLFHEERAARAHPLRFGLWIDDNEISFDCRLEDVETQHIPDLLPSLEYANRRYREELVRHRAHQSGARDEGRSEAVMLAELGERIRSRFGGAPLPPVAAEPPRAAAPAANPAPVSSAPAPPIAQHEPPAWTQHASLGSPDELAEWTDRLGLDALGQLPEMPEIAIVTTHSLVPEDDRVAAALGEAMSEAKPAPAPAPALEASDDAVDDFEHRRRALRARLRNAAQTQEEPPRGDD